VMRSFQADNRDSSPSAPRVVGKVVRDANGVPVLHMKKGAPSPSLMSGNPHDGVPELADPEDAINERMRELNSTDPAVREAVREQIMESRWPAEKVKGLIDDWRNQNDYERAHTIKTLNPRMEQAVNDWLDGTSSVMPRLDIKGMVANREISAQEGRMMERTFYGEAPVGQNQDPIHDFNSWVKTSTSEAAGTYRVIAKQPDYGVNTGYAREAMAYRSALNDWRSQYLAENEHRLDFDRVAFQKRVAEIEGTHFNTAEWVASKLESGGTSVASSLVGMAERAGRTAFTLSSLDILKKMPEGPAKERFTDEVWGKRTVSAERGAALQAKRAFGQQLTDPEAIELWQHEFKDGRTGGYALTRTELEMSVDASVDWAKGALKYVKEKTSSLSKLMDSNGRTLEGNADWLAAGIDAGTLTEADLRQAARSIQQQAYTWHGWGTPEAATGDELVNGKWMSKESGGQAALYDLTNPNSPLSSALAAYKRTGDPSYIENFKTMAKSSPSEMAMMDAASRYASKNGAVAETDTFGAFDMSRRGFQVVGAQEMVSEVAGDLIGMGVGKALILGVKGTTWAKRATAGVAKAEQSAKLMEKIAAYGTKEGATVRNFAVQAGKMAVVSPVQEYIEEAGPEMGNPGGSYAGRVHHAGMEGAWGGWGGAVINTAMGAGAVAYESGIITAANKRDNAHVEAFVKDWNTRTPEDPVTSADVKQARNYVPAAQNQVWNDKIEGARVALQRATEQHAQNGDVVSKISLDEAKHRLAVVETERAVGIQQAIETARDVNSIEDPILKAFADAAIKAVRGVPLTEVEQAALERAVGGVPPGPVPQPMPALDAKGKPIAGIPTPQMPGVPLAKRQADGSYIITDAGLAELETAIPRTRKLVLPVDERSQIVASQAAASQTAANAAAPGSSPPATSSPGPGVSNAVPPMSAGSPQPGSAGAEVAASNSSAAASGGNVVTGQTSPPASNQQQPAGQGPQKFSVSVRITYPSGNVKEQPFDITADSPEAAKAKVESMPTWQALKKQGARIEVASGQPLEQDKANEPAASSASTQANATNGSGNGTQSQGQGTAQPASASQETGGRGSSQEGLEPSEAEFNQQAEAARQQVKPLAELLRGIAAGFGYKVVDTGLPFGFTDRYHTFHSFGTQILDKAVAGSDIGQWIDKVTNSPVADMIAANMTKPGLHRVWFGHDPLANLATIIDKFGVTALPEYAIQLLKDMTTKSGIPLPGVQWLVHKGLVGDSAATQWLSLNVGEALGAGLGILGTYRLYKKARDGKPIHAGWAIMGIAFKLVGGVMSANPFLLLTGLADTAILVAAKSGMMKQGMQKLREQEKANANTNQNNGQGRGDGADGPQSVRGSPTGGSVAQQKPGTAPAGAAPQGQTAAPGPGGGVGNSVSGAVGSGAVPATAEPGGTKPGAQNPVQSRKIGEALTYLQVVPQNQATIALARLPKNRQARAAELLARLDKTLEQFGGMFTGGVRFVKGQGTFKAKRLDDGTTALTVNIVGFLDDFQDTNSMAAVQSVVGEELIHLAAMNALADGEVTGLWNALPQNIRQTVWSGYRAAEIKAGRAPAVVPDRMTYDEAWQMGHEFHRILIQKGDPAFMGLVTEAIDASPTLGQKIIDYLKKFADILKSMVDSLEDGEVKTAIQEQQERIKAVLKDIMGRRVDLQGGGKAVGTGGVESGAVTIPGAVMGAEGTAYTEGNEPIGFRYAVVEAGDLTISNTEDGRINPAYPAELQPRDRTSAASEAQVNEIAGNSNLDRLSQSNSVGDGAPFVGPDGVVESGNGRAMALNRAYQRGMDSVARYRENLAARAGEFGLDPAAVSAMQKPVLVRVRTTSVDRAAFAQAANVATVAPMREVEIAKKDAGNLNPTLFDSFQPSAEGDIFTASNAEFIRGFVRDVVPQTERAAMVDRNGNLTQTGQRRVRNAVFAYAYGTNPEALNTLSRLTEDIDPANRSVTNALVAAAPIFAEQNARMKAGALHDLDITADLVNAVTIYNNLRARGETVADYLDQIQMPGMGEQRGPLVDDMLQWIEDNKRSGGRMFDTLRAYATAVEQAGDPRQGALFGESGAPTKEDLWESAKASEVPEMALAAGLRRAGLLDVEDQRAQIDWLNDQARSGGYASVDEMAVKAGDKVITLAKQWRKDHPAMLEFPDTMGSLGIPRADMPQIKRAHRGAMTNFLNARGISLKPETVPASALKPSQADFSPGKVAQAATFDTSRRLLISADNHVLDGHHQWLANYDGDVEVFRLDAPAQTALEALHAFPSSKTVGELNAAPRRTQTDEEFDAAFKDWKYGMDERGLPNPPRTLPEGHPLLEDTLHKKTAEIPADHALVKAGILKAGTVHRAVFREAVIKYFISQGTPLAPNEQPMVYASAGGGGAGKTTVLNKLTEKGELNRKGAVQVNADDIKELIPEYELLKQAGDGAGARVNHEESSLISKALVDRLLDPKMPRYSFVYDATLANYDKALGMFDRWKAAGYKVHLIGVTITPMQAMKRAALRAIGSVRWVPGEELAKAHQGFNAGVKRLAEAADVVSIYDNTPPEAKEVAKKDDSTKGIHVVNPSYWSIIERRKEDENADQESPAEGGTPESIRAAESAGRLAGGRAGSGESNRPAALREVQREGQGDRGRDSGEVGGEAGSGVNAGLRRIKDTGTGDLFAFGESNAPATSNQGFNLLDTLTPAEQQAKASGFKVPDPKVMAAFKVGDRVQSYQGAGAIFRIMGDTVKLRLDPDGHLSNWINLSGLTPESNNPVSGDQAGTGAVSGAATSDELTGTRSFAPVAKSDIVPQSESGATAGLQSKAARSKALAGYLSAAFIKPGKLITWQELFERADEAFGGTQANGAYTVKDAYDALEMAFNQWLLGLPRANPADATTVRDAESAVLRIKDGLQLIPTQTKRTQETDDFQQFSTVPPLAFVANWVAGVSNRDIMLEPSSGPGGIAVFSKAAGATVIGNELSPRRAALARESGIFDEVFQEDAEQIHNILPKRIRPTVVVMNPPFSNAATRGVKGNTATATRHIEQALARLEPGGRLVAIVGEGMAADRPAFRGWWQKLGKQYTIRANIQVNGAEYVKYGTSWDNQIVVIDKVAPKDREINGVQDYGFDEQEKVNRFRVTFADKPSEATYIFARNINAAWEQARAMAKPAPIYGRVEKVEELPALLYGIRNERPAISDSTLGELGADRPASGTRPGNVGDKPGSAGATTDSGSAGANAAGTGLEGGTQAADRPAGSRASGEAVDAAPQPDAGKSVSDSGSARSGDAIRSEGTKGNRGSDQGVRESGVAAAPVVIDPGMVKAEGELTDAVYDGYVPRITFPGAHLAPTPLSESSAMAAVTPPNVAYRPSISADIYADKNREPGDQRLAAHALEAATLAGAAHEQEIEAPTWFQPEIDEWTKRYGKPPAAKYRRGFFIGDGTGAGKGRQVAAIMLDNWNKGRKRHVWISEKPGLLKDALRDMRDVTGGSLNLDKQVFPIGGAGVKATDKIDRKQGIGFTSYATLRSEEKNPAEGKEPRTRIDQIVDWVGEDFDGVIAFDEAHNMGNVVPVKGSRGNKQVSQQALAGLELQRRLPNARIVYLSATGATEVENLGYAERLGVWGPKTPFANVFNFINEVGAGGVAAMELIAQNLKAMGLYVARALSWGPVTYAPLMHELTPDQRQMYDTLADAWQVALKDMYKAMELTGIVEVDAESGETSTPGGKQKGNILGKFWGAHQRFFSQIITTVKMPTVLAEMDKQLAAGNSVVVQLVNTQAAAADRSAAKQAAQAAENGEELDLEMLDLTPKEELMQMVMSAFPTTQMEQVEITDDQGNGRTITRPVKDSAGNLVENAEAVALRDALLDKLAAVRVPNGPLEILTDHFGHDKLAEITGRQRRLVWMEDKKTGEKKREWEKRSEKHTQNEIKEFQDGKRRVLVFSKKGGTGESFHADRRAKNQQKRVHILLQPGWQAAAAVQGFGRTHRNNQVVAPHYILAQTDVAGEKRFISSIARRLDQLGALTKGQRQTGSQGFFNAQDNLESEQAAEALQWFYREAMKGKLEGIAPNVLEDQMGLKMRDKDGAALAQLPPIKQFLNRILSLNLDLQDVVFAAFFERLGQIVESQREAGTLDVGMETLTALHTKETGRENVYLDESNGSRADLVTLELTQPTKFQSWDVMSTTGEKFQALPYVKNKRTGKVRVMTGRTQGVNEDGVNYDRIRVSGPTGSQWVETSKFWSLWDRVEGSLDESRAAAKQSWQEQREAAGETHTQTEHLLVGTMLPIWNKIPGFPRVLRAQTDDGIRMIGRSIPPGRINEMLTNLGKAGKTISPDAAIAALYEGVKVRLSNKWFLNIRKVSGEERIELTGPDLGDTGPLARAGVFNEKIQWTMRYFLPKDRAAEVLEKLLDQTTATITDAGSGKSLSATNKRALPVEPQLDLVYVPADGKDASSAQESRARTNPLDAGRDVRTSDTERLPSTPEAMLPWARSNGWLIDNASLFPHLGNEVRGGDEHDVWGDESTQRAIKLTLDTHFVQGSPSAYLENLQQQNELFNTGYAFEGVADDNGMARFVVSQPWVIGNSAEQKAKDAYFQALGFDAAADDMYYSMGRDLLVSDAKPANVLQRADGTVQPIDVQVRAVNPRQAERYENMVAARQTGGLAAGTKRSAATERFQKSYGSNAVIPYRFAMRGMDRQELEVLVWNDIPVKQDYEISAVQMMQMGSHLYRLSVLKKPDGTAFAQAERFKPSPEFPMVLEGSFDSLSDNEIEANSTLNDRARKMWEDVRADDGQGSLFAATRLPGQMPTGKMVNGTAQFVKAQEEAVKSQLSQEEQEKANKLGHKIKAAGTAGIKREASEAWANMVSGNIDRLDFYAPGFRDIWLDSERKLGLARAAVNGVMEKLHARAKAGFGYPAWWKNPLVYKRWKNFQSELLPVAARLEVEAINPDGSFAWKPFDMRAGDIDLRKVQALGKKSGDVIMVNGEPLVIGRLYEEQAHSFTSSGVVVKKHLLLRPMSAAAQQQVYDSFLDEWAGFPVAGELLTEFIMPGMAQAREVGPRGIRTAAFNRYSLLDFFNEWPPELQQLFGSSPMKAIPQIEGYTPDLFTLRGLSFMIAGLAKAFKSGARQVKSGAARESGNVQNLMEGFSTRLMEAHREKISLERRARVINAAAKPMNQVPDDQKHKWLPLNDAFNKLYELAVVAKGLDRARYPKITGALSPDQEAFMRQLVGEAWALRGRNLAVPEAIYRDMVGELAVRDAENLLLKAVEWLVDRFNAASLASTGFVAMNWLGNEIMKTSYMAGQAFKAGTLLAVGDTLKSRLVFDTMAHMVKGMVVDRFPLRQQRIRDVVPRELFDNDQAIKAMKGLSESVLENLKGVNVGGAILAAMKSGNWDVGAKVQLAYAAYRAHMKAAWRAAGRPGNAEVWMKHWLENDAPDTLHREVQLAAGLFLMDYQNVPRWMDASSLKPVVSDPDHPARGVMLNQVLRLGVKTVIPFIRWQYSFAKSVKRQGWDAGLKQLVTGKDKAARAEAVGNVAALGMMVMLPALVSALGEGEDDDKDKIAGELIGRVQDLEGGKLPQTLSAKNRFNVSALARILATRLGMSGHSFDVTDEAGDENDLWMRYRNYPYIKEGVVLGLAVTGQREAFGESWTSLFQEYAALGIAWQLAETMFGARDQYGTPESQIGGMAFDVATSPVLPHRMLRDATTLIDPTDRRLTPSKSLDYAPGFTEGVMSRLPGLKDNLPVAGNIKQPAKISARTTATPAEVAEVSKTFGIDPAKLTRDKAVKRDTFADLVKLRKLGATQADVKVSTNDKGQQTAAYPDPDTVRKKSRFYELMRATTAANLLPVKREAYKAAVLGKEKGE
jgi:predicted ABC-type ATPase